MVPCVIFYCLLAYGGSKITIRAIQVLLVITIVLSIPTYERVRRYHNNVTLLREAVGQDTVRIVAPRVSEIYKLENWGIPYTVCDSVDGSRNVLLVPDGSELQISDRAYSTIIERVNSKLGKGMLYYPPYLFPSNDDK